MQAVNILLYVVQVLVSVSLIGLVLLQHGKGADAGAAFGSGASGTLFGSQGSGSFLSKLTAFLAAVFLANSLLLAYVATTMVREQQESVLDVVGAAPAAPPQDESLPPVTDMPAVEVQPAADDLEDLPAEVGAMDDLPAEDAMEAQESDLPEMEAQGAETPEPVGQTDGSGQEADAGTQPANR